MHIAPSVTALQPEEFEEYIRTMVTERDMKNYVSYAHEKGKKEGMTEGIAIGKAEGKAEGLAEGKAEGEAIGEVKGIIKTARNLKAIGIPIEQIMQCTGLSAEEVDKL